MLRSAWLSPRASEMERGAKAAAAAARANRLPQTALWVLLAVVVLFRHHLSALLEADERPFQHSILEKMGDLELALQELNGSVATPTGPRRPPRLCSYTERELDRILRMKHGSRKGQPRYYHSSGAWVDLHTLQTLAMKAVKFNVTASASGTVCTIVSIAGQLPCEEEGCLLQVHWRPWTRDAWIMEQYLEKGEYDALLAASSPLNTVLDAGTDFGLGTLLMTTM